MKHETAIKAMCEAYEASKTSTQDQHICAALSALEGPNVETFESLCLAHKAQSSDLKKEHLEDALFALTKKNLSDFVESTALAKSEPITVDALINHFTS